jgi:hypothetical protein
MAKKLFKASDIADMLGISRQAVDQAIQSGRIEKNEYVTDNIRGWTPEQMLRIYETFLKKRRG